MQDTKKAPASRPGRKGGGDEMAKDLSILCTQLRVPRSLWLQVRHAAVDSELSANQMAIRLLEEALEVRHVPFRTERSNSESDESQKN